MQGVRDSHTPRGETGRHLPSSLEDGKFQAVVKVFSVVTSHYALEVKMFEELVLAAYRVSLCSACPPRLGRPGRVPSRRGKH